MKEKRNWTKYTMGGISALILSIALLGAVREAEAQSQPAFTSGSTGADGDFNLKDVPPNTIVNFEPGSLKTYLKRDINWDDNRFDFGTITIPAGVTVRLSAKWSSGPVYWLATGLVQIDGLVDLSGENGADGGNSLAQRKPSIPGPGGYPGGVGLNSGLSVGRAAQPGAGPLGGLAGPNNVDANCGLGGGFAGNQYLVPLQGGSGAGGGNGPQFETMASGGAGGGAILIASTASITVGSGGRIAAFGGAGGNFYYGAGGSGGAIRLAAPMVQGNGSLDVTGGRAINCPNSPPYNGGSGRVRIDAFTHSWTFGISGNFTRGSPLGSFVPAGAPPAIVILAISTTAGGQTVPLLLPQFPTGSFELPDATINSTSEVSFDIRARGVPANTVVDLYIESLEGPDIHVTGTLSSDSSLATFTTSTTISKPLPPGFSRGYVRAKW